MRIERLRREQSSETVRVTASVAWEDCDRPPLDLYFETASEKSDRFAPGPNAFLLAAVLPAFRRGERRLLVEGEICPRLRDGVLSAMAIIGSWYRPDSKPVRIEASRGFRAPYPARDRAAFFVTGGVDSLHVLWRNRRDFPADHPASIRSGVNVAGLPFPDEPPSERSRDLTARTLRALAAVSRAADFEVLWTRSNLRQLESETWFLAHEAHSSALAASAHAFEPHLTSIRLASSFDLDHARPWGSHPLLDPNYSSCAIEMCYEGPLENRFDRLRRIADWRPARDNMVVCFEGPLAGGVLNCGRCEKCVRTMVMLVALGRLEDCGAFPRREVHADDIDAISIGYHPSFFEAAWGPLREPLRRAGRADLLPSIEEKIAQARRHERWLREEGWKGRLRRLDRAAFRGSLLRLRRKFS